MKSVGPEAATSRTKLIEPYLPAISGSKGRCVDLDYGCQAQAACNAHGAAEPAWPYHQRDAFDEHPRVGEVRGLGYFWGIELVEDKGSKAPFDPKRATHRRIKVEAFGRVLLVYPMGGTIDGRRGDHVLLAPPFIVADAELEMIVERLTGAVDAATKDK